MNVNSFRSTLLIILYIANVVNTLTLMTYFALLYQKPEALNRPSLRIVVVASFALLLAQVSEIIDFSTTTSAGPWETCIFTTYLILFGDIITMFLFTCIALNLVLAFVLKKDTRSYEKWYYIISIALAFITVILPYAFGNLKYLPEVGICFYSVDNALWPLILYYVCWFLSVTTSVILLAILACHLYIEIRTLHSTSGSSGSSTLLPRTTVLRVVQRVALYPLVMIIIHICVAIWEVDLVFYKQSPPLLMEAGFLIFCSYGIFVPVLLFSDTAIQRSFFHRKTNTCDINTSRPTSEAQAQKVSEEEIGREYGHSSEAPMLDTTQDVIKML